MHHEGRNRRLHIAMRLLLTGAMLNITACAERIDSHVGDEIGRAGRAIAAPETFEIGGVLYTIVDYARTQSGNFHRFRVTWAGGAGWFGVSTTLGYSLAKDMLVHAFRTVATTGVWETVVVAAPNALSAPAPSTMGTVTATTTGSQTTLTVGGYSLGTIAIIGVIIAVATVVSTAGIDYAMNGNLYTTEIEEAGLTYWEGAKLIFGIAPVEDTGGAIEGAARVGCQEDLSTWLPQCRRAFGEVPSGCADYPTCELLWANNDSDWRCPSSATSRCDGLAGDCFDNTSRFCFGAPDADPIAEPAPDSTCQTNADCEDDGMVCDTESSTCVWCTDNAHCTDESMPVCVPDLGNICTECWLDSDCATFGDVCAAGVCLPPE